MPKIVCKIAEVFIYKKAGNNFKFLLLKRDELEVYPGIWSIAGGEIGKDEKAYEAGIREMKEETGLTAKHFYTVDTVNTFYDVYTDEMQMFPVFLAEANEDEVELSNEHSEFSWMDFDEAYEKIFFLEWKDNLSLINKILKDENLFRTLKEIKI